MSELPLLPDQPTATDQVRRFVPPAAIALAALLFIGQNTASTTFRFLWFRFRWPLWIMLVVSMAVGAAIAYAIARRVRSRRALAAKRSDRDS